MSATVPRLAFIGRDITPPSVLWMRRMLDGLADVVGLLALEDDPGEAFRQRFPTVVLTNERRTRWQRLCGKLGIESVSRANQGDYKLQQNLLAKRIDRVLVHYAMVAVRFADLWEKLELPVFVYCHGFDVSWDMRSQNWNGRPTHKPGYSERVARLPANVTFIANSRETSDRLSRIGISGERVVVNHIGVSVPDTPPTRQESERLTIVYLGRLVDCKGPDLVIRAFEIACSRGLNARLIIAGDGPLWLTCELMRLRSTVADSIVMRGPVNEAEGQHLLRTADIFTAHHCKGPVSNQVEAFGVSVVEAMAAALPVVVGRSGGVTEIVRDRIDGHVIEPGDVQAHAEALLDLAASAQRRRDMGMSGWSRARECFTHEAGIERLRHILFSSDCGSTKQMAER